MEKNYELGKRENGYLPTYSSLVTDICKMTENKEEKEGNYLSFRTLTEAFYHFSAGIESEIDTILRNVLESINLSSDFCHIKVDKEKKNIFFEEDSFYSNSRMAEKLIYRELEGNIYLEKGPAYLEDALYKLNYKLMTDEYDSLKRLYNLALCRDVYPSKYQFECENGWIVHLSKKVASIEFNDENTPKVNGESCFYLKQSIVNYGYKKDEPLKKEMMIICGDPKITQYVHQNLDAFLEGFKVDIGSMPSYIRDTLLNYQKFQVQKEEEPSKEKTLMERFRAWKNSLKG